MLAVKTTDLELMQIWFGSDERARVQVTFPINKWAGAQDTAVVFFELEPGDRLPVHTDSAEEILYIVAGTAEAQVGEERGVVAKGDLAVIPAMVPHGLVNIGDDKVTVVGFFSESEITSSFDEPIEPIGAAVVVQGAPAPVTA
jgi:quercetin dioxygenase-like cupin family protein